MALSVKMALESDLKSDQRVVAINSKSKVNRERLEGECRFSFGYCDT